MNGETNINGNFLVGMGVQISFSLTSNSLRGILRIIQIVELVVRDTVRLQMPTALKQAQLSQRGRPHDAELISHSNRIYTVQYGVCKFLLVFHCNHVSMLYRF